MTTRADEATDTLIFYFRTLYEAAGLDWGWDNAGEIRVAVNDIIADAVRQAVEEATGLVTDGADEVRAHETRYHRNG